MDERTAQNDDWAPPVETPTVEALAVEAPSLRSRSRWWFAAAFFVAGAVVGGSVVALFQRDGESDRDVATDVGGPASAADPGRTLAGADGDWSMQIDPAWTALPPGFTEARWGIGDLDAEVVSNVNVLIEEFETPIPLEDYVEASSSGLDLFFDGVVLPDPRRVVEDDGTEFMVIDYEYELEGADLRFVQLLTVTGTRGAVVSLVTGVDGADELVDEVLPSLLTFRLA